MGKFFLNSLRFVTGSLVALYFLLPIVIRLVPGLSKQIIFLAFITRPFVRYDNPQRDYNLTASRNFYLDVNNDVRIGVWQFLPRSSEVHRQQSMTDEDWERSLSTIERPIFLYLHGNAFNRAALHRRELYDLLADMRYHVLAFDYRGFGDSTGTPTSDGLVADSMFVYKWLQERAGRNRILLWGHSLGTAVATELAAQITDLHEARTDIQLPLGVILEAPFNNLAEVIQHHPIAKPMRWLPWFEWIVQNPIRDEPVKFDTDVRIERTTMPFLIVHAEDDHVVPFFSGQQLYRHALDKVGPGCAMVRVRGSSRLRAQVHLSGTGTAVADRTIRYTMPTWFWHNQQVVTNLLKKIMSVSDKPLTAMVNGGSDMIIHKYDVKYAGLIPYIPTDLDATSRTEVLRMLDLAKLEGHIMRDELSRQPDAVLELCPYSVVILDKQSQSPILTVPIHMVCSVGLMIDSECCILTIKIGEVGGNKDVSDLCVLYVLSEDTARCICNTFGQCFQAVFSEASTESMNQRSTPTHSHSRSRALSEHSSASSFAPAKATLGNPSFITGSRQDLDEAGVAQVPYGPRGKGTHPWQQYSSTTSESNGARTQHDTIQEFINLLCALLTPSEMSQFASLLNRWRADTIYVTEFAQKLLELYGQDRKHLLARMRPFILNHEPKVNEDFEHFLEVHRITENAASSIASWSPASDTTSRDVDIDNSIRLTMTLAPGTEPIDPSKVQHHGDLCEQ